MGCRGWGPLRSCVCTTTRGSLLRGTRDPVIGSLPPRAQAIWTDLLWEIWVWGSVTPSPPSTGQAPPCPSLGAGAAGPLSPKRLCKLSFNSALSWVRVFTPLESKQVAALRPHSGVEVYLRMRPQLPILFWDLKLLVGSSGQRYLDNL